MITGLRHALGVSRELELLYQVAEVRRGPPRSAEVRELLYQVAEVREVREVREVPGGYGRGLRGSRCAGLYRFFM